MQEISSKLGPALNIGDTQKQKEKIEEKPSSDNKSQDAAQKYTSITKQVDESGDAYRRESTVASISNVGFQGDSRATTPLLSSRQKTELMKENFENE